MATARKKNLTKTPLKNPSKAMAGKSTSVKTGIKAVLTAIRGKGKASAPAKSKAAAPKAKPAPAKPVKALSAKKGSVPAKSASKPAVKSAPVVQAKPLKGSSKTASVQAPATPAKKGKAATGKNSAAFAAAAAVQKVTARLSGRGSPEVTSDTVCREVACEGLGTTAGYCRLHYIKNWRKIKRKEVILKEGKLNIYIEELVAKYPEKYLEAIRSDLANDKEFAKVIHDLDLDESIDDFEGEGGDSDAVIDTIKRDFDDDTETF